jgi:hypothetical protein
MNLIAQHPDPRIPLSVLLLALAHSARLAAQRQPERWPGVGDVAGAQGGVDDDDHELAQEEPERWDGLA